MTREQQAALDELRVKTLAQIQAETAATWAYRAWAAYTMGNLHDAVEYEHEAIEHAALAQNYIPLLAWVRALIDSAKPRG